MKQTADLNLGNNLDSKRKTGNTTRQIDKAIQLLFEGYTVIVRDHHRSDNRSINRNLDERLLFNITTRLHNEHNNPKVIINTCYLTIKLGEDKVDTIKEF